MRSIISICVFLFIGSVVAADDWPQWLGPKRDGGSAELIKPWKAPLKVLWKQPVGDGHGGPVVAKGSVFVHFGGVRKGDGKDIYEETLAAFDADTGKQKWTKTYERKASKFQFGNGPRGAPCVVGGKVYTFGITSILTCFNADDGKIVWQIDTAKDYKAAIPFFGSSCSPIVVDDKVMVNVGGKEASIVAFDKNTGKELWKKLDDGASYSSPIIVGEGEIRQVVFLTARGLVSIFPRDGSIFWQHPLVDLLSESSTTPVVIDDILFASSITTGSIGLKLENNRAIPGVSKAWNNAGLTCYFATPVAVGKDTLYMVTGNNPLSFKKSKAALKAVDAKSGKELWTRDNVGAYHASLLRTGDNKLLLVEEPGNFVLIDPNRKEYTELARTDKVCGNTWAHPALANGRVYIRDAKDLICVELPK